MWKITNQSDSEAEVLLYDTIADFENEKWGFINAKSLINKIKALGNIKNISLRINSVGGDVFEAQAMYSYLKSHPANITVKIDGLAASAASLVAMAGNKIIMPKNALMMIHNPSGGVWGESEDMKKVAGILDIIRDTIANVYVDKTGLDREKVISMMDAETWMTATEAHDLKFCDEVGEVVDITAMAVEGGTIFKSSFGCARVDDFLSAKLPKNYAQINTFDKIQNKIKEVKTEMDIKNAAELERAFPEFVDEIRKTAVQSERERIKALDTLNAPGCEEIIAKAKYAEPKDARDIALEVLQARNTQTQLNALHQDASAVNGALSPQKTTFDDEAKTARIVDMIAKNVNSMRGLN